MAVIHRDMRSRGWCFTINNFSEEEKRKVSEMITHAKYGLAEIEHSGEGEGTPHIQGYVYFDNAQTFERLRILLGGRAHIEKALGNPQQNYDYCSKENTVFIKRELPIKFEKTPFLQQYHDMQTMAPQEFANAYPKLWFMHRDKVERIMIDSAMKNVIDYNGPLEEKNIWIWGKPGVGKSRWAASNGSYEEIFKKNFNKWWDGYNLLETKIVILEDYPCTPNGNALVQHMKIWGDRYPFEAECKGSHLMVEPRRFFLIITSNYPIDRCFDQEDDKEAIHRRFKEIECRNGDMFSQCLVKLERKWIELAQ